MKLIPEVKAFGLAVAFCLICVITATSQAAQAVTLDSLHTTYTNEVAKIDARIRTSLDVLLDDLTKKGDFDGYKVVATEAKRFKEGEAIVADAAPANSANSVLVYQSLLSIATQSRGQQIDLLAKYIEALKEPLKNLMAQKNWKGAEAVDNEIKASSAMMAELKSQQSKDEKSLTNSRVSAKTPPKREVSIVGKWHRDLKNWDFLFDADGTFKCFDSPDYGNWTVSGDTVTMHWKTGPGDDRKRVYTLEGTSMFSGTTSALGKEVYTRIEESPVIVSPAAKIEHAAKTALLPLEPKRKALPVGAVEYEGHHYLLMLGRFSWHEAKDACEKKGGHLVTIGKREENSFVRELVKITNAKTHVWIGLTNEEGGKWVWVDGTPLSYKGWGDDEPNATESREHYAELRDGQEGWNDTRDLGPDPAGYICEWDY